VWVGVHDWPCWGGCIELAWCGRVYTISNWPCWEEVHLTGPVWEGVHNWPCCGWVSMIDPGVGGCILYLTGPVGRGGA
jgi:hypothetical protein